MCKKLRFTIICQVWLCDEIFSIFGIFKNFCLRCWLYYSFVAYIFGFTRKASLFTQNVVEMGSKIFSIIELKNGKKFKYAHSRSYPPHI